MSAYNKSSVVTAYIALGSNLGDSRALLYGAISAIGWISASQVAVSSFWKTTPVDCPQGSPEFLNAVVAIETRAEETPETLLQKLQDLEKQFGRTQKKIHNESRPLDLDIIAFGQELRQGSLLCLPHPRAHLRMFVLKPLAEIAPSLVLAGQSMTVGELAKALPADPNMVRVSE